MTICALQLRNRIYRLNPSAELRYATLGLLFCWRICGRNPNSFCGASGCHDRKYLEMGFHSEQLKYAVMAGAVTGGGLTVIANAPNPVGQAILGQEFGEGGVSPLGLFLAALAPTAIVGACFMLLQ